MASITLIALVVYWRDLAILANEALRSESVGHVIYVPFLSAYMFYLKRHSAKASLSLRRRELIFVSFDELIGLALSVSALLFYWYGSYTFYPVEYHLASLPILISGIILILFNRKTLIYLIFPILFLLFLVPIPATMTYVAGASLANLNTQVSYAILNAAGLPVELSYAYGAPTIRVSDLNGQPMTFAIDPACSGIYSLTAFAMFATFLAYILKGSIFRKAALFLLGFSTLVALSIFRISFLVFIGHRFGEETAMTFFHTVTGSVLILVGMLVILFIAEKLLKLKLFRGSVKPQQCIECSGSTDSKQPFCLNCGRFLNNFSVKFSKRKLVKMASLLLGCYLVTLTISVPVFAFAQGSAVTNSSWETSAEIFPPIPGYNNATFLYRDTAYEQLSRQDASLLFAYIPSPSNSSTQTTNQLVYVDVGVADSISNLHNWEVCYVSWQTAQGQAPLVPVLDSRDNLLLADPLIIARYFVFEYSPNLTQVTLYWFSEALFNTGVTVQKKYVRTSLIILASGQVNIKEAEDELLAIAKLITMHWEPLKQQSLITIGIPILQSLLIGSTVITVTMGVTQYTNNQRTKRNNLKVFENFATKREKLVLQKIQQMDTGANTKLQGTTLQALQNTINKTTSHRMSSEILLDILNNLEKNGLIEKDIVNIQNQPILVWKF